MHKQKGSLSLEDLIPGVWGESLRHLPKVINSVVGGPWPQVWVKQDFPLCLWTLSFYTGWRVLWYCSCYGCMMIQKEQGCSSASIHHGALTGIRISNASTLFDEQSCLKPLGCAHTPGIPGWFITWRRNACFGRGRGTFRTPLQGQDQRPFILVSAVCWLCSASSLIKGVGRTAETQRVPVPPPPFNSLGTSA